MLDETGIHPEIHKQVYEFIEKAELYGVNKSNLAVAFYQIGIVACAVRRIHHDVEYTQVRVLYSDPVYILDKFKIFHIGHHHAEMIEKRVRMM